MEPGHKTKLLGVTLDAALSWFEHIVNLVIEIGRGTAITRKCSEYVTSSTLNQGILALVLSHLEYCPVIWSSAAKKLAQNSAA